MRSYGPGLAPRKEMERTKNKPDLLCIKNTVKNKPDLLCIQNTVNTGFLVNGSAPI